MRAILVSVALGLALSACVGDAPVAADGRPTGALGGKCFANGTCNAGLVCVVPDTCVAVDAGTDASPSKSDADGAPPDASTCSLLAWWRGDGDASDERNLRALTWVAGAQYAAGFDLVGTNFLVAQKKLGVAAITVEARIRPLMPEGTILATDKEDGAGGGLWFGLSAGRLSARVNKGICQGSAPLAMSTWHHVAVTYDAGTCTLYLDGTKDQVVPLAAGPLADEVPPYVGANANGVVQTALFRGVIADLAVWSRALAPAEVLAVAAESPPVKCR
jgi:hypothetical protein